MAKEILSYPQLLLISEMLMLSFLPVWIKLNLLYSIVYVFCLDKLLGFLQFFAVPENHLHASPDILSLLWSRYIIVYLLCKYFQIKSRKAFWFAFFVVCFGLFYFSLGFLCVFSAGWSLPIIKHCISFFQEKEERTLKLSAIKGFALQLWYSKCIIYFFLPSILPPFFDSDSDYSFVFVFKKLPRIQRFEKNCLQIQTFPLYVHLSIGWAWFTYQLVKFWSL